MFASRISFEHASQEDDGQSDRRRTTSTTSSSRQQSVNSTMRDRAGPVNADSPASSAESSSMMGPSLSSIAINATIALFGATRANKTARSFVRMALDAGYHVRVLVQSTREFETYENGETGQLRVVAGAMTNEDKIRRVLHKANYVVCMNDTAPSELNSSINVSTFVDLLYPLMKEEPSIRVFLFQSTSLACNEKGKTPVLSKVLKTAANRPYLQEHDAAIRKIAREHGVGMIPISKDKPDDIRNEENESQVEFESPVSKDLAKCARPNFAFIVTRPTVLVKDGTSRKKLSASKSQPGPFPINVDDLAEFTLNTLVNDRYYNSCPYVVP